MKYRAWQRKDNERIAVIEKNTFKSPWSTEMIDLTFDQPNFYGVVCEEDEIVVGYVGAIYDNWDGEILNIAVDENFRGKGIGEKLMQSVIDFLTHNKKEKLFLEVRRSNLIAQSLYSKLGFTPIGIRKKYYENTEDAIVMEKVLFIDI